jgi:2-desacetyl-2-hydroxyethyl bacteriochlorophyllide A dehydrogenase
MPGNPTVVFPSPKQVVIEDRDRPTPGPGQVLIATEISQISTGTELTILAAEYPADSKAWANYGKFPFVPGYSNIGKVIGLGDGVAASWLGARVAALAPHAAFVTAGANRICRVPETVSADQAAFASVAQIVANGVRRSQLQWGECVIVYGMGLLGQLTARFCRLAGARPVFAVDPDERRRKLLPCDSGIIPVAPGREPLADLVRRHNHGRLADLVFEVTGRGDLIPHEFEAIRPQGRLVLLSSPQGSSTLNLHDLINSPSITMIGAHGGSHPPVETYNTPWSILRHNEQFFDLLANGELDLSSMITHHRPWQEAPACYQMLLTDRGQALGVHLDWRQA